MLETEPGENEKKKKIYFRISDILKNLLCLDVRPKNFSTSRKISVTIEVI